MEKYCGVVNVSPKQANRDTRHKGAKTPPITGHTSPETAKDPIILVCEAKKGWTKTKLLSVPFYFASAECGM